MRFPKNLFCLSLSQRPYVSEPEATCLSFTRLPVPWSLIPFFGLFLPSLNFLRPLPNSSTATGPDNVAYPVLKHLLCSGMHLVLHIFDLSGSLHFFPHIWKYSSIIPIHKKAKTRELPASFRPMSMSPSASRSRLSTSIDPVYASF